MSTATNTDTEHPFKSPKARTWLREMLAIGPATVTFTKKDGETRVMTCTLQESAIPKEHRPKPLEEGKTPRKRNDESLSVWDINAQGWRSFIYNNIQSISITLGDENSDRVEGFEEPPKHA